MRVRGARRPMPKWPRMRSAPRDRVSRIFSPVRFQALATISCVLLLSGCGPSDPNDAHFKGTWKHTYENGVAGTKAETTLSAAVDHMKFRTTTREATLELTEV